jgi:hypothetical protein
LHALIEKEVTGTPAELALRMNISERLVYHLIEQLKDYSACIRYNRSRKTYYYDDDFELHVNISVSIISNDEVTHIFGGGHSDCMTADTNYPPIFQGPIQIY